MFGATCTGVGTGTCNVFCPGQGSSQKGAFRSDICLGGTNNGKPCTTLADCPGGTSCRLGTLTNYCCGTTARQAYERGYKVVVGSDVTATDDESRQEPELAVLRKGFALVLTAEEITNRLTNRANVA